MARKRTYKILLSDEDKKELDDLVGTNEEYDEEERYNSLSDEERKEVDDLVGKDDTEADFIFYCS